MEIIDQNDVAIQSESDKKSTNPFNIASIVLLCFSVGAVLYTVLILWRDTNYPSSPWLPEYTPYFINAALINFTIIQFVGVVPALYLRWKKKYAAACYFLIAFIVAAKLLETHVELYHTVFFALH